MSDPVSNAEIEDVLSSIRRLVSEDPSPLHRRKQIAEGAKERFVLTPALRVTDDEDDDDDVAEQSVEEAQWQAARDKTDVVEADLSEDTGGGEGHDLPDEAQAVPDADDLPEQDDAAEASDRFAQSRQTLEQRIAELETALQQSPEEWEPDGSEVAGSAAPDMPSIADAPEPSEADDDIEIRAAETMDLVDEADSELREADVGAPDDQGTESARADADVQEAAGPDITEPHGVDSKATKPEPAAEMAAASIFETGDFSMPEENDTVEEAVTTGPKAAPETAASGDAEDPDLRHDGFDMEPETAAAFDEAENGEIDGADQEGDEKPERFELFEDPAVLDEDAVRDLVSQLVRDELQGVLGERITRNVRRLVRREIQRAIAMRDLE